MSITTATPKAASPSLRYPPHPDLPGAVLFPGTIVIDTREQLPFEFVSIDPDAGCLPASIAKLNESAKKVGMPRLAPAMIVPTVRAALSSGDYSLQGCETEIAIERKSIDDLYGTIGGGVRRRRFEAELERLSTFRFAMVVVEGTWVDALFDRRPTRTETHPKTIARSVIAWRQRYNTVHFDFVGPRRLAEVLTFRTLERYWRERQRESERGRVQSD